LGVVAFDALTGIDTAALWLYMDNSCGVCIPEHAVTRPGLGMSDAKNSLLRCLDFLRLRASELGYFAALVNTPPAMARILEHTGNFQAVGRGKVTMLGLTKEVQNGN
jgi:hypothetical protein